MAKNKNNQAIWNTRIQKGASNLFQKVGNFLTKTTAIIATLFIISSISLVVLSRGDLEETQSVLEREEEENSNLPQIPQSK